MANNLVHGDYMLCQSFEERRDILQLLHYEGIEIGRCTWAERDLDDYNRYPHIMWIRNEIVASMKKNVDSIRRLPKSEFLWLALGELRLDFKPKEKFTLIHKFI